MHSMSVNHSKTFFFQDSIPVPLTDTTKAIGSSADTSGDVRPLTNEEISGDNDTLANVQVRRLEVQPPGRSSGFDTSSVPYNLTPEQGTQMDNPLAPFRRKFLSPRNTSQEVFIEQAQSIDHPAQILQQKTDRLPVFSHELRPDWLLVLILISLILIAWLKLFYNKFFDQTMQSLVNFQLSSKLLRDQNIFSRRVAFALNLNFVLIGGAFVYLLLGYFNIKPFPFVDFISFLIYSGIITSFLLLRYIISHFIGHVFQKHREFQEYLHQIFLIYKNLGIYLIPIVIGTAYIHEDYRIYLIYLGTIMLFASLILRLIKGFKILVNKDVLIFYLILYLCTLEILPWLIFYRFFSLSVLTG